VTRAELQKQQSKYQYLFLAPIAPDHRIILRPGTREERQYVELFCNQTSSSFSGCFSSKFWDYLLPQLSYSEPAISHAVAAISSVHEQYLRLYSPSPPSFVEWATAKNNKFALRQYNKAIKFMMQYLASPHAPLDMTMIMCSLFISLETLRGDYKQALDHLESGLRILCGRNKSENMPKRLDEIQIELAHLFARYNIQLSLFGRQITPYHPRDESEQRNPAAEERRVTPYHNLIDARHHLDRLMNKALQFIRYVAEAQGTIMDEMVVQRQHIRQELNNWLAKFKQSIKLSKKKIKSIDPGGPTLLRILHRVCLVWLEACLAKDATVFDNHTADFEAIIAYASEGIKQTSPPNSQFQTSGPTSFIMEMGILPAIYFTATRWRVPNLRQEATKLISAYRKQEGMWDSRVLVKVSELVMNTNTQEAGLSTLPVEQIIPEDRYRIYDAYRPSESIDPCLLILVPNPDGEDDDWRVQEEYVRDL
jgi:tetratricopeptide (TPR) repeat protein